ncbi:hypothetical protein C8F01DRAFT_1142355 [Mycena amicta]|nr:hypothetical protein C8F01DRAFT_1142355 [Mycena amicta]
MPVREDVSDADALADDLAALALHGSTPSGRRSSGGSDPPPYTLIAVPPAASRANGTGVPAVSPFSSSAGIYAVASPTRNGLVHSWATAAHATQGVPGTSVRRVDQQPRQRRSRRGDHWVVFHGLHPGVFDSWQLAKPEVHRVSGALHCKYPSYTAAMEAFSFAATRSWTRTVSPGGGSASRPISYVPLPIRTVDPDTLELTSPNPLQSGQHIEDGKWYFVYKGIRPGIYRSYLESQLNVVGISIAVHDSHTGTLDFAISHFLQAAERGEVAELRPSYVL